MENYKDCGLTETIKIIGSKWTLPILYNLLNEKKRFSELQSELGISPRTLSMRLDQLEKDNIVLRKVYPVVPPKVEYSLTARGRSLNNLIQSMADWGKKH